MVEVLVFLSSVSMMLQAFSTVLSCFLGFW